MAENKILTTAQQLFGGGNYVYLYGGDGSATVTQAKPNPNLGGQHPEGLGIDCSHLVQQTLAAAGYDVPNNNSTANIMSAPGALNPAVSNYYCPVDLSNAQAGDIIMFRGHMGILQDYDPETGVGHFYGSQSSTGPALTTFTANGTKTDPSTGRPIYWGNNNEPFYGALEPISKNGLVDGNTSTYQQKSTNLTGFASEQPFQFLNGTQLSQQSGENNYLGNVPVASNVTVARSITDFQSAPIGGSGSVPYLDSRLLFGNDPATAIAASQSATAPTIANGVMPNYSFINGALLDTQSGQIAFGSPNGLTDTTTDWSSFSLNNVGSTIDANALTGLNWTAPLTELNNALAGMSY